MSRKHLLMIAVLLVFLLGTLMTYFAIKRDPRFEAIREQEAIRLQKLGEVNTLFESARKAAKEKRFTAALNDYRRILALDPDNTDAKVSIENVLKWQKQYEQLPLHLQKDEKIMSLLESAEKKVSEEKFKEAIKDYEEVLSYHPTNVDVKVLVGKIYFWDKQPDKAEKYLNEVIKEAPDYVEAWILLGNVYAQKGEYHRSIATAQEVLKKHPNNIDVMLSLARYYKWYGKSLKSQEVVQEILKLDPKNKQALELLKK
ncbi:MAG: tetratricopeptide repeat protein [Deltaproteobacteria bacterium]|nr:tetratricopeptide repeat protein [Deltaproteobacteria bacterium]